MFKLRKCLTIILMTSVLLACVTACKSKAEDTAYMREIYMNYSEGDFETALQMSEELPKPFRDYYVDFIQKRIELDDWSGTEEELYAWMEDTFDLFDFVDETS